MKVKDVMTSPARTVGPHWPFKAVLEEMLEAGVSSVPVVNEDGRLLGIVTEADLVAKEAFVERRRPLRVLEDLVTGETTWVRRAEALTARELMSAPARNVDPDCDLRVAARTMLISRVKQLPVVEDGRVVGMLSRRDVLSLFHRTDDELQRDIIELLASPLTAPESLAVEVAVDEGVVTLSGFAPSAADVALTEAIVAKRPGVVAVNNQVVPRAADANARVG